MNRKICGFCESHLPTHASDVSFWVLTFLDAYHHSIGLSGTCWSNLSSQSYQCTNSAFILSSHSLEVPLVSKVTSYSFQLLVACFRYALYLSCYLL